MAHKTHEEFLEDLHMAAEKVTVGAQYEHYKGLLYIVEGFVIIEATNEVGVVYRAEYGKHIKFVRPLSSWLEIVEAAGRTVPRFAKVADK